MAIKISSSYLLILFVVLVMIPCTSQLQSSQSWSLLRIKLLLNNPKVLSSWNSTTDFCYSESSPLVTVVCYEETITQLHIIGDDGSPPLPKSFSIDSFFTTLARLPDVKVVTLASLGIWGPLPEKISRLGSLEIVNMSSNYLYGAIPKEVGELRHLQTLILEHNMLNGQVPVWLSKLQLVVLNLKNNSLIGPLPDSFGALITLRVLQLSSNNLTGNLPDLSGLVNLEVLDLEGNLFGPQFPALGKKLVILMLRNNQFAGSLPSEISSCYLLEHLDVSSNRFVGTFFPSLLTLPSIRYLNISRNRFTGMLFQNMSCSDNLHVADFSFNLLTGDLPTCLSATDKVIMYSENCLVSNAQSQHPLPLCRTQALAVGILPHKEKQKSSHKAILVACVVIGILVSACLVGLAIIFALRRVHAGRAMKRPPSRLTENPSNGYPSKLLADARYISQTMKLGALGIPPYRSFSLEELEAATNNFETGSFMGEGCHGQMYKGQLKDGSLVAIRCLKLKKSHSSQNFNRHIELISKLRHRHLVSALGHCFEYYLDDSSVSRLFLIFEYVSNGTLRSIVTDDVGGQKFTWTQRISVAIGVLRGIQFFHTGIIPGLFGNDLKTTNILLDQNLVAKISSYNLPVLSENIKNEVILGGSSNGSKDPKGSKHGEKTDIYNFGVILLEILSGRAIASPSEVNYVKDQLQTSIAVNEASRRSIVDPVIRKACPEESLNTVVEICIRCLSREPTERPSVEDVLWNLQFAAQVQDGWRGDSVSSEGSPLSTSLQPPQSPPLP